jgi:hypothetical protein
MSPKAQAQAEAEAEALRLDEEMTALTSSMAQEGASVGAAQTLDFPEDRPSLDDPPPRPSFSES